MDEIIKNTYCILLSRGIHDVISVNNNCFRNI